MSDIRFNRWLHQSGTGGVYQDGNGRVGIGTSVPTSALDVQSGSIKIGSNTLSSSGVSTFTNLVVSAGTTSAPSISPSGDSNTGIFFPSADTVCIGEGGAEVLRVDSNGRLGVGTINPLKTLDVRGEATFGVGITTGDLNWGKDTYQQVYTFSGITGGSTTIPADGVVLLANPNANPSNTRVGGIVFGNKVSGTTVTGNAGIKGAIESYTNTNVVNAADTGGYLRFQVKPDNGELGVQMQLNSNGNLLFNSGYGSAATAYGVRAWVRFNGSGSNSTNQTISGSGNVSTVFKNGTGDYTVNFTNAFVDANYAVTHAAGIQGVNWGIHLRHNSVAPTTSAYRFKNVTPADSDTDAPFANLAFYR
jgi:hypothetical protein